MKINASRFKQAFKAMTVHFGLSLLVAAVVALLVFTLWFPYPYRELAGGRELFILVMAVDIVCGPLLTFVLFSPTKPKKELLTDISLVAFIQILALSYGIWTVWQVRPVYLVQEADKLNIISWSKIDTKNIETIAPELKPQFFSGPIKVSLRAQTMAEQLAIDSTIPSAVKDKSEQPNLYITYDGTKAYTNGRPVTDLLRVHPSLRTNIEILATSSNRKYDITELHFLYIVGRQYWIAVINPIGEIIGYV